MTLQLCLSCIERLLLIYSQILVGRYYDYLRDEQYCENHQPNGELKSGLKQRIHVEIKRSSSIPELKHTRVSNFVEEFHFHRRSKVSLAPCVLWNVDGTLYTDRSQNFGH